MTPKRSLFLECNLSLALSPHSLKERLNTSPAFICSFNYSWLLADFDRVLMKHIQFKSVRVWSGVGGVLIIEEYYRLITTTLRTL